MLKRLRNTSAGEEDVGASGVKRALKGRVLAAVPSNWVNAHSGEIYLRSLMDVEPCEVSNMISKSIVKSTI